MRVGAGLERGARDALRGGAAPQDRPLYASEGPCYFDPMSDRDTWKEIYDRFDPERPAQDDHWRAARPLSPASELIRFFDVPVAPDPILLVGTVGTGKTTELLRIAEARAQKNFVVFLDLVRHFGDVVGDIRALQHIRSWEVCFLAGLALIRAAREQLGHVWSDQRIAALQDAWEALARETKTPAPPKTLDVGALASTMAVVASEVAPGGATLRAGLKALGAATKTLSWSLPIGLSRAALPDQRGEVQAMLAAVNGLFGDIQTEYRGVLLIVDGLDRITDFGHASELFLESELVGRLASATVVCGPYALRHHMALGQLRRFRVHTLVNEPVMDHGDPSRQGPGVAFFRELYAKRTADLPVDGLVAPEQISELAYYSGGRARDFVRLVRELALRGMVDDVSAATEVTVRKVLDAARMLVENGLNEAHRRVLEKVRSDPRHLLPAGDDVYDLLLWDRLLPYPNESEWFYPHPLLTLHFLAPTPSGSASSPPL